MSCEHDFIMGLDNVIRCRLCGMEGGEIMEILGTVQSLVQARRVQDEIASHGDWLVADRDGQSVIYSRSRNGTVDELKVEKKGERQWQIVKITRQKEG